MLSRFRLAASLALAAVILPFFAPSPARADGLIAKDDYFPIGVWCQQPRHAEEYKAIGINLYIALWDGPTEQQLAALQKAGMNVACHQNKVGLDPKWNQEIVAWLQDDEPDNAQELPNKKGYGPPVLPSVIVDRYQKMKAADKENRPVMLNLDMSVAYTPWFGRGTRSNHPEDYPKYVKGGDVVSFDIYPMCASEKQVAGKMSLVGLGVTRLANWVDNKKPVFTCIETTHISNPKNMITPEQIRSEVWMAIIHGARGIIYFCHEFQPKENDAALLARPEIVAAVKKTNAEVQSLARVINTGKPVEGVTVDNKNITLMTRQVGPELYIFASASDPGPIKAAFTFPGEKKLATKFQVIGESRTIDAPKGTCTDTFTGYETHIYKVLRPFEG